MNKTMTSYYGLLTLTLFFFMLVAGFFTNKSAIAKHESAMVEHESAIAVNQQNLGEIVKFLNTQIEAAKAAQSMAPAE